MYHTGRAYSVVELTFCSMTLGKVLNWRAASRSTLGLDAEAG